MSGGAVKPCGCGPLEPCALHRDAGDLQDWEARAVAAEAKLATLRRQAETWAALAPADDWGLTTTDTVASDCGRAILAIIGTEEESRD